MARPKVGKHRHCVEHVQHAYPKADTKKGRNSMDIAPDKQHRSRIATIQDVSLLADKYLLYCKCRECWFVKSPCGATVSEPEGLCEKCSQDISDGFKPTTPQAEPVKVIVNDPTYWANFLRRLLNW